MKPRRAPRPLAVAEVPSAPQAPPPAVVGVGASAGGLEALRALFAALRGEGDQLCFVVVQHLAPAHRSRLVELIGQTTPLAVREIRSGDPVLRGVVYITPPNADVVLHDERLELSRPHEKIGPKPSIDRFLRSLAESRGENAMAVILSGTGSDGAEGIRAVKAAGGVTLCQSLRSAKYDGMPRSAKMTGCVDLELPPEELARQLALFNEQARRAEPLTLDEGLPTAQSPYVQILSLLERSSKVDFGDYKPATVRRRIARRMIATRCQSVAEYAEYLRSRADELRLLFQDILISVTSFFRDLPSYRQLGGLVAARLRSRRQRPTFRCWVVGCATGEEAYSLAMVVHEAMEQHGVRLPLQVFATDVDERAMAVARKGLYPKRALGDIPAELREKYLEDLGDHVRVREFLREMIVFARHDVTRDPPFLKLDLVSCRNVLIYFNAGLQERVLRTFHYALEPEGLLFLGKSEATSAAGDHFTVVEKTAKIFARGGGRGDIPSTQSRAEVRREASLLSADRHTTSDLELFNSMIAAFAPDSLLLDDELRVRHTYGNANRFLRVPRGAPTSLVTKLLQGELGMEAATLLHRAVATQQTVRGVRRHPVDQGGEPGAVTLAVAPVAHVRRRQYLLCFHAVTPEWPVTRSAGDELRDLPANVRAERLEQELRATREHLQTLLEEHETANEELQALNEELQSSNEEMQSTNEELETTNEELQSANEELTTLNEEINVRSNELLQLNQRLQAIQNAIFYPLLVLDTKCRVLDYNPAARLLLRVTDLDRGQHLHTLGSPLDIAPVLALIDRSLETARDGELQMTSGSRTFEIRVQLFRGHHDVVEGVVVSFVEVTELVTALADSRLQRQRVSAILDNTPAVVTMKDATGRYLYVNPRFEEEVGIPAAQAQGRTDEELLGAGTGALLRERDFEVVKLRQPLRTEDLINRRGEQRAWLSARFPLVDESNSVQSVCTVSLDVTDQARARRQLEVFHRVVSASNAGLAILEAGSDAPYRVTLVSEELARKSGVPRERLVGVELETFLAEVFRHTSLARSELAQRIASHSADCLNVNLDELRNGESWVEIRTAQLRDGDGGPRYLVVSMFDTTRQVQAQRALAHQQEEVARFSRLAALGEVAAGISHEINTPLNVVTTRTELLRRLATRGSLDHAKVAEVATDIEAMVRTISNVITGLRSLARMESEHALVTEVGPLVREAARICDFRIQRVGARLAFDLADETLAVECYPVQVVQVLINLINNAVDAVADLKERWIRVTARGRSGRLQVLVTDSGRGISPDAAERIMAPFYTTKQNGTGLGLSISRNIARRHGGDLTMDASAPNTTFVLELPLSNHGVQPTDGA